MDLKDEMAETGVNLGIDLSWGSIYKLETDP